MLKKVPRSLPGSWAGVERSQLANGWIRVSTAGRFTRNSLNFGEFGHKWTRHLSFILARFQNWHPPPCDSKFELKAIFSSHLVSRRWVIEEVFHSQNAAVSCGPHNLEWQGVQTLGRAFFGTEQRTEESGRTMNPLMTLEPGQRDACVLDHLRSFSEFECVDNRD